MPRRPAPEAIAPVRERVRAIIVELAPIRPAAVTASTRLIADLGYDSLGLLELAAALEHDLGLPEISAEDATSVQTLGHAQDLVVRLLGWGDG
jgi:acyl carrier protein